jgi:hypothetical protein
VKAGDWILIAIILSLSLFLFARQASVPCTKGYVRVIQDSKQVREFRSDKDGIYNFPVKYGTMRIELKGGAVRVAEAECPQQLCVNSGWIRQAGQSIVCVPNRIIIELQGGPAIPYDGVTH